MSQSSPDETFFEEVVLTSTKGIITIDGDGWIVFANEAVGEVLDRNPGALVGKPVTDVLTEGEGGLERIRDAVDPVTGVGQLSTGLRAAGDRTVAADLFVAAAEQEGDRFLTLTLDHRGADRDRDRGGREPGELFGRLFGGREEPFVVFDADDATVVHCNRPARELFGGSDTGPPQSARDFVVSPTVFTSFLDDVTESGEGRREEFSWRTGGDGTRPMEVVASPFDRERSLVLARARDVSEQNQLRAQRRRRTAALGAVGDGVAVLDGTFEHTYVNDSYGRLLGRENADELAGEPVAGFLEAGRMEGEIRPAVEREGQWRGTVRPAGGDGTAAPVDAAFRQLEDGAVVVVLREASETAGAAGVDRADGPVPRTPGAGLSALDGIRDRLAAAGDPEAVAGGCVDAAADLLGDDLGCLRLEAGNALEPAAMTASAERLVAENPGFELGLSDAGRAYRTGEPVVRDSEGAAAADLLATSAHVPVGDHGVLTVATTDGQPAPPAGRDALALLAVCVETALDRVERTEGRGGDAGRTEPTGNAVLAEEFVGDLVTAETRAEVEELVCSTLAAAEPYGGVWTADVDATGERLRVQEAAGVPEELLSSVDGAPLSAVAGGAVADAIDTDDVTVLDAASLFGDGESPAALPGDTARVVPLTHGDKVFGCAVVHVSTAAAFGQSDRRGLAALGEICSFTLSALENERLLLSDEFVELEFQVTDPSCLAVALSDRLDTSVSMKRTVRNADDEFLSYVRVTDTSPDAAVEAANSIGSVRDSRVVNDYEYGCLIEVVRATSGAEAMMEFGATMRSAEADCGRGILVLEAPHTADVRRIVEAYQSYNPESELLTKRRVDRPRVAADQLRADIEDELTEKQHSAVSSAYYSGYYEWPRESTAEDVADAMGISASTLHQHLRHAHKKLLTAVLERSSTRHL